MILSKLVATAALLLTAQQPADIPVHVGGRVVAEGDGALRFGWPAVYFEGRFEGTAVRVRFDAPREHMRLLVDGEERGRFLEAGPVDVTISGLALGSHVVRLEKLTESQAGSGRFLGFSAPEGSPLPPRPRERQVEFIGDSHSAGYGNVSPLRECSREEVHDTTDSQQAFGPIVARALDADYRVIAYSGFGIVRNYGGGEPSLSLPIIYDRTIPDTPAPPVADPRWRPQLIVINLGANDFSTPLRPGERWADDAALRIAYRDAYVAFVRRLQAAHPQARFLLVGARAFIADVDQVAAALNAGRDAADPLAATMPEGELALTGCDWHPSVEDNRQVAQRMLARIEQLGIWPAR